MSIQVKDLSYIYNKGMPDEQWALKNVTFDVNDGEILGVIGHTGSGKSTLMQQLNGLLKPESGSIIIDGLDITQENAIMRDVRRKVGLVFQYPEYQLFDETVALDVAFGPKNLGLDEDKVESSVREAIELVGLSYEKIKDRSPFELSGGQKRRVAIAGVIAMKPKVLILDEPTAGLDPAAHKDILKMIGDIHRAQNNIIIFVSHNMADIAEFSDKVLVMEKGSVFMCGTPEEVFSHKHELNDIGLDVPPANKLMWAIREAGAEISTNALSIDDARKTLMKYIGNNQKVDIIND